MTNRFIACAAVLVLFATTIRPSVAGAQGPKPLPAQRGIMLSGRIQEVYNTTSVDSLPADEWALRRVRIGARFRLNRFVSGRVQQDYSGDRFSIKDAYVQLEAGPGLRLLVGQSQRPFSPIARANELRIPVIEKTAKIRGLKARDAQDLVQSLGYSSRDVGFQLLGTIPSPLAPVDYEIALLRGPLDLSVPGIHPYQLGARLSAPVAPRTRVGAAWSRRDFVPGTTGSTPGIRHGNAFVADLEFGGFDAGPHLIGEVISGEMDPYEDRSFRAVQGLASYRFNPRSTVISGVEPGVRASSSRVVGGAAEGGFLLTPALSAYVHKQSRITLNYNLWSPESGAAGQHDWKLLFQLAF